MTKPILTLAAGAIFALCVAGAASASQVVPGLKDLGLKDLGRATSATRVLIAVSLKYHHEADLERLIDEQVDDSSPLYHHFLDQQQFRDTFAPTAAEYARAIASLQRAGFTVNHTYPNRTIVDANGPATVAERYFSTEIHRVMQGDRVRYVNLYEPTIPAEVSDIVDGVVGLTDVRLLHADHVFLPPGAPRPANRGAIRDSNPLFGPDGGYGPQIFEMAYDLPSLNGFTGSGRASGVATDADFLDSDLAGYLSYFGVTRTGPATTRVKIDGGPLPGNQDGDSVETALDVETIVSLAPGTALYVYEAPQSSTLRYFIDIYNQAVSDNFVDQMNSSYSECETALVTTFPKMSNKIEKQGAAEGITFHASSGDGGTETYGCGARRSVGTPTDTPYNVSVGGTIMQVNQSNGQETSEVGWNDSSGATGGGVSVVFKTPGFQKKIPNVITTGRNLPDVAFDASPYTGESYYYNGGFEGPIGGTSLSSPIFGASVTEMAQLHGARAGWLDKFLYKAWLKNGYSHGLTVYIRDITSGSIPPYSAQVGYDQMTGFGALIVSNESTLLP